MRSPYIAEHAVVLYATQERTVSTPDAQPSRLLPRQPHVIVSPTSAPPAPISGVPTTQNAVSYPTPTPIPPPRTSLPMKPLAPIPGVAQPEPLAYEHAIDFATHSWDLKTGGLKTLTAKRELPTRLDRRSAEPLPDVHNSPSTRSYMIALIVLVCVIFMLIGGGVILFVILQP